MADLKKIYFDYAATTPVDPGVEKVMLPYFGRKFGNPSSLHGFGQEAIAAIDDSRNYIARSIGADSEEIIFTGSATEANNLTLRGVISSCADKLKEGPARIVTSKIEHSSIIETCRDLENKGVEVVYLPVNKEGLVDLKDLKSSLNNRTVLVSIIYANNEIGVIQPILDIANIIKSFRVESSSGNFPLFHIDAVQAFQFFDCRIDRLGVDFMTISAHKIYGPKGVGMLYSRNVESDYRLNSKAIMSKNNRTARLARSNKIINPLITGGGQEFNLRSGTENVPAIVGFHKAIDIILAKREEEKLRLAKLRDELWLGIKKIVPKAEKNGPTKIELLPNILNVYFPGRDARELLTIFDLRGLMISAGSACHGRLAKPSHVLLALGDTEERARQSLRFSLGRPTSHNEVESAIKILGSVLKSK